MSKHNSKCSQLPIAFLSENGCIDFEDGMKRSLIIYAMTYCNHAESRIKNIDFPTKISSMTTSNLQTVAGNSSLVYVRIEWIPLINQSDPEQFCAIAYTKFVSLLISIYIQILFFYPVKLLNLKSFVSLSFL